MIAGIWEEFLKIVGQEAGSHVVHTWLKAVSLSHWDALQKIVYLQAPNPFVQEWIKTNYMVLFQQHLQRLLNVDSLRILFVEKEQHKKTESQFFPAMLSDAAPLIKKTELAKRSVHKHLLNKSYVFDTFVVGPNSQLAYAAAYAVTEKIGQLYNPLFIYGASGLGKTHLLQAVGNRIKELNKDAEILYQTADRFVNEFIHAIRYDKVPQFKAKYKNLDVLLIDDIQFISNKEQTHEAFFHIFNMLYEDQKQIVFSSDCDPSNIQGLAERLRSRFSGGLVTDIQIPSLETKIAILRHKADLYRQKLSDEVIMFIANYVTSNIRELEGAFVRISACAAITNQPITLELTKKVLLKKNETGRDAIQSSGPDLILQLVQKHYNYSLSELRSENRSKGLALARQVIMYFMKNYTDKSLQEISGYLGRKDHSTVIHAHKKVENLAKNDIAFSQILKQIEQDISR